MAAGSTVEETCTEVTSSFEEAGSTEATSSFVEAAGSTEVISSFEEAVGNTSLTAVAVEGNNKAKAVGNNLLTFDRTWTLIFYAWFFF